MKLTSSVFEHNKEIPTVYTCDGSDTNPPFTIDDVPDTAVSLALIMEDPDVPAHVREDRMWDHWLVWNIPPETNVILEGYEPPGVHGTGTSGNRIYHGPCPPDGAHRYMFKLYALDTILSLSEGASKTELLAAMEGHIIDTNELVGIYTRARV
ncbi:MAG: YbhB/YbcL family Raf kinase inhibitor-like protein [Candidatus Andersenbacteria bacterium]